MRKIKNLDQINLECDQQSKIVGGAQGKNEGACDWAYSACHDGANAFFALGVLLSNKTTAQSQASVVEP